jgi:replicative DNA helicase
VNVLEKGKLYLKNFADLYERLSPRGLTPPQAVELEESLLGSMLISQKAARTALDVIGPRTEYDSPFYRDAHTLIYLGIASMETDAIDLLTVKDCLEKRGTLEKVGGAAYLVELTTKVVTTVNTEEYVRIVLEKYLGRELIRVCEEIKLRAFEGELDIFSLRDEAESFIYQLGEVKHSQKNFQHLGDIGFATIKSLKQTPEQGLAGITYGLKELDDLTGGGRGSEFTLLAARPSMGKTSLGLHFVSAASMAEDSDVWSAVFSLEMIGVSLGLRMLCETGRVSMTRARNGWLNDDEWKRIMAAQAQLMQSGIYIDDQRRISVLDIRSKARHLATKMAKTNRKRGRIIVDNIALTKRPGKNKKGDEIGEVAWSLKELAEELDVDMIALSQITRDVAKRASPRPGLADIAESGEIEEHIDNAFFLYRAEVHKIEADSTLIGRFGNPATKGIAEIDRAKARNGPIGMVYAKFIHDQARFEDCDPVIPEFEKVPDVAQEPLDFKPAF